jgi:hypothetical protein
VRAWRDDISGHAQRLLRDVKHSLPIFPVDVVQMRAYTSSRLADIVIDILKTLQPPTDGTGGLRRSFHAINQTLSDIRQ